MDLSLQEVLSVTPIFGSRSLDAATGGRTALCPGAAGHQEDVEHDPLHPYRTPDTGVQTHQKGHGGQQRCVSDSATVF